MLVHHLVIIVVTQVRFRSGPYPFTSESMAKIPETPERTSSMLPTEGKYELTEIRTWKYSAISARSTSSNVSEFLDAKVRERETNIEYDTTYRKLLRKACEDKEVSKKGFKRCKGEISEDEREHGEEYVALKRRRELIEDDWIVADDTVLVKKAYAKRCSTV